MRPAVNSNLDDQASGLFSFETNHAVQELVDFYKKNMREQGLAFLERVSKEGDQAVGAVLNASGNRKLQVQIAREGKVSRVSVAYSKP